eukprot:1155252-Pelagomonas_calceolata.AAC.4
MSGHKKVQRPSLSETAPPEESLLNCAPKPLLRKCSTHCVLCRPPYLSNLVFELWELPSKKETVVRVLRDRQPLDIPHCPPDWEGQPATGRLSWVRLSVPSSTPPFRGHRVLRFQNAEQFIATQGAPVTPRKLLGSTSVASWLTNIGGLAGPGKKVALVCTRNAADMEMIYRIFRAWVGEAIKEWHLFEGAKDWSKTLCVTVWLELEGPFTGATYPVLHLLALMNMLFWLLADSERA